MFVVTGETVERETGKLVKKGREKFDSVGVDGKGIKGRKLCLLVFMV